MTRPTRILAATLLWVGICAPALGAWFDPVPNIFENLQLSVAADVNEDFDQLRSDGNLAVNTINFNITGISASGVPVGATMYVNSTVCPSGWVVAAGGSGAPDLRGVFIRGLDLGAMRDPGRTLGSYQADSFIQHSPGAIAGLSGITSLNNTGAAGAGTIIPKQGATSSSITATIAGGSGPETRPRTIVYTPCYKAAPGGASSGSVYFSQPPVNLSAYVTIPPASSINYNFAQIVADGNAAFTGLQNQINSFSSLGTVPANAVVGFWSASCPAGWVTANGVGGTPDMRGRFAAWSHPGFVGTGIGDSMASHTHSIGPMPTYGTSTGAGSILFQGSGTSRGYTTSASFAGGSVGNATTGTFNTGETRPKSIALLYCMKS